MAKIAYPKANGFARKLLDFRDRPTLLVIKSNRPEAPNASFIEWTRGARQLNWHMLEPAIGSNENI
jgi:hypothetical protein